MFSIRAISLGRAIGARSFHSPFTVLSAKALSTPVTPNAYAKQSDWSEEPVQSLSGTKTYVVSTPGDSEAHYDVPAGVYPVMSPYNSHSSNQFGARTSTQTGSSIQA